MVSRFPLRFCVPGKSLGKLAKAVERIDVRALSISSHGGNIKLNAFVSFKSRLGEVAKELINRKGISVLVIEVQGEGVSNKVLGSGFKPKLGIDSRHGVSH